MYSSIDEYIKLVPDFDILTPSEMIPFFAYYCSQTDEQIFTAKMIRECFDSLSIAPYSNIHSYLRRKSSGKEAIFLKRKTGYKLTRSQNNIIEKSLYTGVEIKPTNNLMDLSLVSGTPGYIVRISEQMNCCYDNGLYDAFLIMMRKLFESLVIECYERFGSTSEIKDGDGVFYSFSKLITSYIDSIHWSTSRNFGKHIKNVKKYGDLSAHNRKFLAKKSDIDGIKFEMRQCLQEIILTIDYQNWDTKYHSV